MLYAQTDRSLKLKTPLGEDKLVLVSVKGREALSELFRFELETVWEDIPKLVPFDQLLGQRVQVAIQVKSDARYFNGIVSKITQGERTENFATYWLEIVPQVWLLTRKTQSRIFQQMPVPDILKKVLEGMDVAFELQGTFEPREYCVQYRETDFDFASRLMEEEGIYYFFNHAKDGHKMVLANTPQSHSDIPYEPVVIFEEITGHEPEDPRVNRWRKMQELRSGKTVLWDHTFELPHKHLEAEKTIQESVQAGTVTHKLKVANNEKLELYDWPGGYAQRFDGIDKGGGDQSGNLSKIYQDNQRTVEIRMQEEAAASLLVTGEGCHAAFTAGHAFTLNRHFSDDGKYVLVSIEHEATQAIETSGEATPFEYGNRFTCIPSALPYRPPCVTEEPDPPGVQTAVVVGPPGEEIFTDKYGRVKVQFHWDRQGKNDANSSCWLRVGTPWAGKQWGMIHIPRIGQEVIVDFLEGDPDRPIIVGSVYNAEDMPPYSLPDNKTISGIKSRSSLKGTAENFNQITFEDKKGSEMVTIHAEKDQTIGVEHDEAHWVGHDRTKTIDHDETIHVKNDRTTTMDHDETQTVHGKETITTDGDQTITIKQGNQSTKVEMGNRDVKVELGNQTTKVASGSISMEAMQSIELKVGQNSIKIDQTSITINGMLVSAKGQVQLEVTAPMTSVNGDGMTTIKGGLVMIN